MNNFEKVIEIIKDQLGGGSDKVIDKNTSLSKDLGFGSIEIFSTIVEIESEFGIEFDDDDLDMVKLDSIGNILGIVERLQQ